MEYYNYARFGERSLEVTSIRLLIAGPHRLFRRGLGLIFQTWGGFEVVGEAEDGYEAVNLAERLKPDVALIDIELPGLGSVWATKHITELAPACVVVTMAATHDDPRALQAIQAGAWTCLLKDTDERELVQSIRDAFQRRISACSGLWDDDPDSLPLETDEVKHELTLGEMDVLRLVAYGQSNKAISTQLGISERTVANRLRQIFQKLNVENRTQATLVALRHGWAEFPPNQ